MNKCALVIPLHPKHYNYGYYIINTLDNCDADVYFIFSTGEDKNLFVKNLVNDTQFKYLILSDFTDILIVAKTNSWVSIKKLYALSILYNRYDYISCIDSEVHFIKKTGFYEVMKNIVNNKTICGGKIHNNQNAEKRIVLDSLNLLIDPKYHEQLKQISLDYSLYTWWTNLPVYDCSIAADFLSWIDFKNTNLERFSWFVFDDMTYNFYCILIHNYQAKLIPNCNHSLEFSNSDLVEYVDKTLCKLYWVNNKSYKQNKVYYENNDFYIVYHLDRF
jgi:hypothetical protein